MARCLSIVAPSGQRIALGQKTIEVRSWKPDLASDEKLLIIENSNFLHEDGATDPEGRAVAIVGIGNARDYLKSDIPAACASCWEAGYFSWELTDVQPVVCKTPLTAKRGIYEIEAKNIQELHVQAAKQLPESFESLVQASQTEGHEFVARTQQEWRSNINNFSKSSEVFFLVYAGDTLVACGGVNIDPYSDEEGLGRIRHVYVAPEYRRLGVATHLLNACISHSKTHFKRLRLKANSTDLGSHKFYEKLGFNKTSGDSKETHVINLKQEPVQT